MGQECESDRFGFTSCSTQSSYVSLGKLPELSELRFCHLKARRVGAEWVKVWAPCRVQAVAGTGRTPSCSVGWVVGVLSVGSGLAVPPLTPTGMREGRPFVILILGSHGDGAGEGTPPTCARLRS